MRAGILTYHNTRNCGAVLQAYALQNKLTQLGIESDIIDYRCPLLEETYKLKKIVEIKDLKELMKWSLTIRRDVNCQNKFDSFRKRYLCLSKPYFPKTIAEANKDYNAFIVGSDQVWNCFLNGVDTTFFLDFTADTKKKISYAASLGYSKIPDSFIDIYQKYLPAFDAISVREAEGRQAILEFMTDKPVEVLPDPVLLLSPDEWGKLAVCNEKEPFIFVYTVAPTKHIEPFVKKLSSKTGLKVIWGHMSYRKKAGVINRTDLSPEEFLGYIQHARYVVTSSFHGLVFATIFHKPLFYDLDNNKQNNNSRLRSFSQLVGLASRCLSDGEYHIDTYEEVDFCQVDQAILLQQKKATEYLLNSLN